MADVVNNPIWIKKMEVQFDALDFDGNGSLDPKNFRLYARKLAGILEEGQKKADEYYKVLMEVFYDHDHGKQMTEIEFIDHMGTLVKGPEAKTVVDKYSEMICKIVDPENKDFILYKAFEATLKAANFGKRFSNKMFAEIDTNRDGVITKPQIKVALFEYLCTTKRF